MTVRDSATRKVEEHGPSKEPSAGPWAVGQAQGPTGSYLALSAR